MLRTFGEPVLLDETGRAVTTLRRKDLALLIYVCLSESHCHSRAVLAAQLWGEDSEARARHSLTQSLRRIRAVVPGIVARRTTVERRAGIASDAALLLAAARGEGDAEAALELYTDRFLRDFDPGRGAAEFVAWAARKRQELGAVALRLVDRLGREAEERADWEEALRYGRKAIAIERIFEEGHRRIMRAWCALGERGLALAHYNQYAAWSRAELGTDPDPRTRDLVMGAGPREGHESARTGHVRAEQPWRSGWQPAGSGTAPGGHDLPRVASARTWIPHPSHR